MKKYFFITLFILIHSVASYAVTVSQIEGNSRYRTIVSSLRCLICQNQAIADSTSDFAQDIRKKVIKLLQLGYTNKKIINYFIQRYGEYIYYRPIFDIRTFLLWCGPFLVVLLGVYMLIRRVV